MVNVKAYQVDDRVMVHYYDSGHQSSLCCPECSWNGSASENCVMDIQADCFEVACPKCGTLLAMISSVMNGIREEVGLF